MIDLAYLTGLRMGDLRQLTWRQITEAGVEVEPAKTQHSTGAKILIPITNEIREVLERARAIGKVKGTTVIHNLAGAGHSSVTTTEGYLRGREIKVSALGLRLPGASNSGGQNSTDIGQKPAANSTNR